MRKSAKVGCREKGKVIDRFRDDLGLTHFTGIGKSTFEINKSVNQSLERRVWSGGGDVGRSREGIWRF